MSWAPRTSCLCRIHLCCQKRKAVRRLLSNHFQKTNRCMRALMQMEDGQETRQRMVNDKLSVSELASTALSALPPVVALPALTEALRASRYQTFPITPNTDAALRSGARAGFCIRIEGWPAIRSS